MSCVVVRRMGLKRCESGSVAILFGLTVFVIFLTAGLAIDVVRTLRASTQLGAAADAAALAAAKRLEEQDTTDGEIIATARKFFDANVERVGVHGLTLGAFSATPNRTQSSVRIVVDAALATSFGKLAGVETISIPVNTTAIYKTRKIELAMMLDVTGSMGSSDKIGALRRAAQDAVDIVIGTGPAGSSPNKVALAPYAAAVNAGPYAAAVSNGESVDGCVFERTGSAAFTDDPPDSGHPLKAMRNPSDPSNDDYSCPAPIVQPLSNDPAVLRDRIAAFSPAGWTAGHLGTAWAWYLISPNWTPIWPAPSAPVAYDDDKTIKAVILMTDGQFNTFPSITMDRDTMSSEAVGASKDQQTRESNEHAAQLCESMRARKVMVFAVGFDTAPADEVTLRGCVSEPGNFYTARDETELRRAFSQIAGKLTDLRLSQ